MSVDSSGLYFFYIVPAFEDEAAIGSMCTSLTAIPARNIILSLKYLFLLLTSQLCKVRRSADFRLILYLSITLSFDKVVLFFYVFKRMRIAQNRFLIDNEQTQRK